MAINQARRLRAVFIIPLALPLIASLNVLVDQAPNKIMAEGASASVGTALTVKKGEIFYTQPLGRANTVSLASDVSFTFQGQPQLIGKAEALIVATMSGTAPLMVGANDALYCTAAKLTGKKRTVGLSEIGDVGMDLDAISKLRHVQTQSCVIDVGSDGTADTAFIADTSNRDPFSPTKIAPTPLQKVELSPMPGLSQVQVMFDGPVGIIGNMSTSMQIVEEGRPLGFSDSQVLFRGGSLPHTVVHFGAIFTILSYDRTTKSAQIRIDQPFPSVDYSIHRQPRYR